MRSALICFLCSTRHPPPTFGKHTQTHTHTRGLSGSLCFPSRHTVQTCGEMRTVAERSQREAFSQSRLRCKHEIVYRQPDKHAACFCSNYIEGTRAPFFWGGDRIAPRFSLFSVLRWWTSTFARRRKKDCFFVSFYSSLFAAQFPLKRSLPTDSSSRMGIWSREEEKKNPWPQLTPINLSLTWPSRWLAFIWKPVSVKEMSAVTPALSHFSNLHRGTI